MRNCSSGTLYASNILGQVRYLVGRESEPLAHVNEPVLTQRRSPHPQEQTVGQQALRITASFVARRIRR